MVPGDDPVIQTKHHIGDAQIVESWPRKPLQYRTPVIADVARDTALERR
jgi:hypothetical protein